MQIELKILDSRLGSELPLPQPSTDGSAGIDLRAMISETAALWPGGAALLIPTGIAINIKDPGYAGVILPRSGLGHKNGVILGNSVGLIDSDYQGQIMVSLWNRSDDIYRVRPGERIAQLVIVPVVRPVFVIVDEFYETKRGVSGFGSTGVS